MVRAVAAEAPRTLVDLLEQSVATHGRRTLFLTKRGGRWQETTYAEFGRTVELVRAGLAGLGVGRGDRVGIIAANRLEWAAVAYAAYQLGAVLVPMYESQLPSDWGFIVRDSEAKVLIASTAAIFQRVTALPCSIPTLKHVLVIDGAGDEGEATFAELLRRGAMAPVPAQRPDAQDVACLMYTSGTTGEPKGVILSHENVISNVTALRSLVPVEEDHRTLSFLPWAHAFGHTVELHMVVHTGASMAIAESLEKIVDNLVEVRPTVLVAVPRVFMRVYAGLEKMLAARPRSIRWLARRGLDLARDRSRGARLGLGQRALLRLADRIIFARVRKRMGGRLEFAISGAAALPREVAELVEGLGIQVYEGYGLTETSPVVSANVPGHRKLGSVGRPLPGVRVAIDTAVTGDPRHGEIVVSGPNVTRGYHNRRQETRAALTAEGALRTGDIGYLDEDGYLHVTGRIKEQYKLANGKYVSPAPLEERLKLSPFIGDCMIYGENRLHNVALLVPDLETVRAWAVDEGIDPGNGGGEAAALLRDPRVLRRMAQEIELRAVSFRGYERIVAFALLEEGFTQENGMLTPSMKLKRRKIVERWRAEIDRLYRRPEHPVGPDPTGGAIWIGAQGNQETLSLD